MNVRCNYCGHSLNLSREYIAQAVADAQANKQKSVVAECVNCRKHIKIPVKQMLRYVPRPAPVKEAGEGDS